MSPSTQTILRWTVVALLLARELFVTILRQLAESRGVTYVAVATGKIKMFLQSCTIGAIIIHWLYPPALWSDTFIAACTLIMLAFTTISGLQSLRRPRT